jgi:uncharacterized protein with ParB-like and HNH nuclease domain
MERKKNKTGFPLRRIKRNSNNPPLSFYEDALEQIDEPFDPSLIRVESKIFTLDLVLQRLTEDEIDLEPEFQRHRIWTDTNQSKLIESILLRIPLPAFYMDASNDDRWLVVDGLQRLTAIKRFVVDNELALQGLEYLSQFEHMRFQELPRNFQRRIYETQITVFLIEKNTPPAVKFNIFKRINTGGMPLTAQEIRHALNQGKSTRFLKKLAESESFKDATRDKVKTARMEDRELILRFLAFTITPYFEYKFKDFDGFLNNAMLKLNQSETSELSRLRKKFDRAMITSSAIFADDAFRKRYSLTEKKKNPFNKALFETWATNLGELDERSCQKLIENRSLVKKKFVNMMNTEIFDHAVSQSTGDVRNVFTRFRGVEQIIKETLNA